MARAGALSRLLVPLLLLAIALAALGSAGAATYSEDAVKAAFLHRFAAYVEWPEPDPPDAPFPIGIVQGEGVARELEKLLPGLRIGERRVEVRRVSIAADLAGVRILYTGPGALTRNPKLVAIAVSRPILIVSDEAEGLSRGAVINFVQVGRKLRLEISLPAADRSGLKIDSGLLSVAERVEGRPQADAHCSAWTPPSQRQQCMQRLAANRDPHRASESGGGRGS